MLCNPSITQQNSPHTGGYIFKNLTITTLRLSGNSNTKSAYKRAKTQDSNHCSGRFSNCYLTQNSEVRAKQGQRSSVVPAKFNARKWKHVQKAKVFEWRSTIRTAF
jgi:hypothetical protein